MCEAILIVGGGLLQVPAVETAHQKGLMAIVTDRNPKAPAFALADYSVVLDTGDVEGHIRVAREFAAKLNLRGVFTEGADVELTVSRTAHALGLSAVSPEAAYACKNKRRNRDILTAAGIPQPRFEEVGTLIEAERAARKIGLPVMVKAVDNCASRGVRRLNRIDELCEAFDNGMRYSQTGTVLIEECLEGPEQSLETLVQHGRHYHLNIVDRPFGFLPFPIELGHINPSELPPDVWEQMFQMTDRAAEAVGIDNGVAKADFMFTRRGPVILEMTARLSGGFDCQYTSPLAHGVNYISAAMDIALGKDFELQDITPNWHRVAACLAPFPPVGRITRITGVEQARNLPCVKPAILRMNVGDLIPPYKNCADRPCFVITVADARGEAWASAQAAAERIRIQTEPVG